MRHQAMPQLWREGRRTRKDVIVSYDKSFHGRTLGSQQAGGIPALKEWIVNLDPGFVQIPFPDGFAPPTTPLKDSSAPCANAAWSRTTSPA